MIDKIEQALDTLYERVMEMPNKVLDIFNNFFGEERVDMQGFPSKLDIRNLYKLSINSLCIMADMKDKPEYPQIIENVAASDNKLIDLIVEALLSKSFINTYIATKVGFILVHFPHTVVTNEYDRSTIVNNIYVKVPIAVNGSENGLFTMNRSEYTVAEMFSNYMHSHASNIPKDNFSKFVNCCLGSGPLNHTQTSLSVGFDEDKWNLFCLELSKYVEVESIAGAPYHRLENIHFSDYKVNDIDRLCNNNNVYVSIYNKHNNIIRSTVNEFLSYYLTHNNLTFSYRNGVYSLGMPFIEYLIHISNSFIEYVNNRPELADKGLLSCNIIKYYTIKNGELYQQGDNIDSYIEQFRQYIGQEICVFKGKSITVTITDLETFTSNEENKVIFLNVSLASQLLNRILRTINYRYERNQKNPNYASGKIEYQV